MALTVYELYEKLKQDESWEKDPVLREKIVADIQIQLAMLV